MLSKASEKFSKLSSRYKAIYTGLLISTVALFMPWYSDVDAFNAGATYLGITGPTSIMGITLVVLNILTAGLIAFKFRFKKEARLPFSRETLEKVHGPIYLYITFLMMSVYFSDDFGINLAAKTAGFGVYVGVIGAFVSTIAGLRHRGVVEENMPRIIEDVIYENDDATRELWAQQQEIARSLEERESRAPIYPPSSDQSEFEPLHDYDQEPKVNQNHIFRSDL